MLPRSLTIALALLISIVWAVNVVIGFLQPDRHDPTINGIFALVVGAAFALGRKDKPSAVAAARRRIGRAISGQDTNEHDTRRDEDKPR